MPIQEKLLNHSFYGVILSTTLSTNLNLLTISER